MTITFIFGDSIFSQANKASFETKISAVEEAANVSYNSKLVPKYTGEIDKIKMSDIVADLKKQGFEIETRQVSSDVITGIKVKPKELKITENGIGKITVEFLGSDDGYVYYAVIDGAYYLMRLTDGEVIVERKAKNPEGSAVTATLKIEDGYDKSIVASAIISENEITVTGGTGEGTTTLTITYGEGNRDTCTVKISPKVTSISSDPLTIDEGKEGQIVAKLTPTDAAVNLSFSTTDTDKITVDVTTGKVKAKSLAVGKTTDTATVTIKDSLTNKTGTCTITIKEAESDWTKIAEISKAIAEGKTVDTEGNPVVVDSNSEEATVNLSTGPETITIGDLFKVKYGESLLRVRVLGFMHDHLPDANGYDEEDARAGISFEFINIMDFHTINGLNPNATGWGGNEMKAYLSGEIGSNKFSEIFRNSIKEVVKPYLLGNKSTETQYSSDKLWLLSCSEIWTHSGEGKGPGFSYGQEGKQYSFYVRNVGGSSCRIGNSFINRTTVDNQPALAWLRSQRLPDDSYYCLVSTDGSCQVDVSANPNGVAPGFCI